MPFTFSHPAILLPLKYLPRKWISMTGLIIGSLTPDFEYFIRMKVQSIYSHTLFGILWFDLPLAILLAFAFHNIVRNDLFFSFPNSIQSRLYPFTQFNWNSFFKENWGVVLFSSLIGALSHLFWDAFTHENGYFVNHISILNLVIFPFGIKIPLWKILQHVSSCFGGIIIIMTLFRLPKNYNSKNLNKIKYWTIVISITILILVLRFSFAFNIKAYGSIIVSVISAFLISLILAPLIITTCQNPKN